MNEKNINEIKNEIAASKTNIYNPPANGLFVNTDETLKNRAAFCLMKIPACAF